MAVYTEVPDEELLLFLEDYGIGDLLSYKGIAEGVENTNYYLHTTKGSYILTLYEKRVSETDLPFFLGLMQHLAAKGLNCPLPLKNRCGDMLGRLAGRPAAIFTFLDGIAVRRPTAQHCAALGSVLGQLHIEGRDFGLSRPNALSVNGWLPLFAQAEPEADRVAAGLAKRTREELEVLRRDWPTDLPSGIIHADLFTDNVFFIGPKVSGLIDFYFACTDALAYDVAICLNAWCFEADGSFNLTKGRGLLSGYQSIRPLEAAEIDTLPILCRGSAMRFMLTRLVDWLNIPPGALVKPKDPLEYDRKLRFHKQTRNAREYGVIP